MNTKSQHHINFGWNVILNNIVMFDFLQNNNLPSSFSMPLQLLECLKTP